MALFAAVAFVLGLVVMARIDIVIFETALQDVERALEELNSVFNSQKVFLLGIGDLAVHHQVVVNDCAARVVPASQNKAIFNLLFER